MRMNREVHNDRIEARLHHFRLSLLVALLIMFSLVLILRLAYLQISQYKRYATLSSILSEPDTKIMLMCLFHSN